MFIEQLAGDGLHHFSIDTAVNSLGGTRTAVMSQLRRLCKSGLVAMPMRGFFVIVPPEYRRLRCLPPEQFIPELMRQLGQPYYAALLTAAEFHGAAHQRPQTFQVMVPKNRRSLKCGLVQVDFFARHDLEVTPVVELNTPRGRIRVSSPEATALEMVGYPESCGGLDNVASVLHELAEAFDAVRLLDAARLSPVAWSQRLGYLLELLGHDAQVDVLEPHVRESALTYTPLLRSRTVQGADRSTRWKLKVNVKVEPDT